MARILRLLDMGLFSGVADLTSVVGYLALSVSLAQNMRIRTLVPALAFGMADLTLVIGWAQSLSLYRDVRIGILALALVSFLAVAFEATWRVRGPRISCLEELGGPVAGLGVPRSQG